MSNYELDPESFKVPEGIKTRYSKKALREGAKYYSTITIADFAEKKPTVEEAVSDDDFIRALEEMDDGEPDPLLEEYDAEETAISFQEWLRLRKPPEES